MAGAVQAVREGLANDAGVVRLARLIGLQSLKRTLSTEDAAVARDIELHQQDLFDTANQTAPATKPTPSSLPSDTEDSMEILSGGPVTVNYHVQPREADQTSIPKIDPSSEKPPVQINVQPPANPASVLAQAPLTPAAGLPAWAKAAILTAALGGPLSGILTGYLTGRTPPPTTTVTAPANSPTPEVPIYDIIPFNAP